MRRAILVLVVLFPCVPPTLNAARPPLVHIQTDRPAYRLGETIWYRVHAEAPGPLSVRLVDPAGVTLERADFPGGDRRPASGAFFLLPSLAGGAFLLEAQAEGRIGHRVAIDVHDLAFPELDLSLTVLGESHCPGDPVTATVRALDLDGKPVKGEQVEYLATFGSIRIRDRAGVTDADGRAVIRFNLPAETRASGHLAVGIASRKGQDAVARPVAVASSVGSIDAFPEGGTIVEGIPQRLGLLVRDPSGASIPAEGRIIDDRGLCVGGFRADRWGLAEVIVPYESGRRYRAAVDRPKGVDGRFPLPAATGHPYSMFADRTAEGFEVEVRAGEKADLQGLSLSLIAGGQEVSRGALIPTGRRKVDAGTGSRPRAGHQTLKVAGIDGIGRILVRRGDRLLLERPVYLGFKSPVSVAIKPRGAGPFLAGKGVDLEIVTTRGGRPIAAELAVSVFQGEASGIPDFAARAVIEPELVEEFTLPQDFPAIEQSPEAIEDSFLLVYGALRMPPEGLPASPESRADRDARRWHPPGPPGGETASRPAPVKRIGPTVARPSGLERLLERAPFTRSASPEPAAHRVELLAPPSAVLATPGLGKPTRTPPQSVTVPPGRVDSRRGLFWTERVKTDDRGRAAIHLKLNDIISDLAWVAEGRAGALPVSGRGTFAPDPGFRSQFRSPDHLHVGDKFDILLEARVSDGGREEIQLDFQAPTCLKPTLRTEVEYDPRKDAALHKFSFLAAAASDEAEFRVVARRGMYREVHARPVRIHERKVQLTHGQSGRDTGLQTFAMEIPREAVPGSVEVRGTVALESCGEYLEWLHRLLRYPTGCFEQFTSQNYVNLVVLEALLETGDDASVIESAYLLARQGFQKLMGYWDRTSGGFSLFPGKPPEVHATVVALRHLALYLKTFEGLGRRELEGAIAWLDQAEGIGDLEALFLTLSLHEIGRTWKGSRKIIDLTVASPYEMALQACCLARWPAAEKAPSAEERRRRAQVGKALVALKALHDRDPDLGDAGAGFMGSRGGQLSVETVSLYALALEGAGRGDEGRGLIGEIASLQDRFLGTQSTALAIHALSRLGPPGGGELLQAEFSASGARPERIAALPGRIRPILFERPVAAKPGEKAAVSVDIKSDTPRPYRLAMSYLLDAPRSSPSAPYRLQQHITPCIDLDSSIEIRLRIEPTGEPVRSQVVARIGLPGGCRVNAETLKSLAGSGSFGFWSIQGGYLDLYWEQGPTAPLSLVIPARAEIAGSFVASPSLIYPYYETGKESYADPLAIKVLNNFGAKVKPEDLLQAAGGKAGGAAPPAPGGPRTAGGPPRR